MARAPLNSRERIGIVILLSLALIVMALGLMRSSSGQRMKSVDVEPLYKKMVEQQRLQMAKDSAFYPERDSSCRNTTTKSKNTRKALHNNKKNPRKGTEKPLTPSRDRRADDIPATPQH